MSRESGSAAVRPAPAVEIEGLGVRYGGRTVLEGVTLQVPSHRITALVGPSGCGKTSLLMALNRLTDLLPGCAVTGRIRVGGRDTLGASVDVAALRRRVGMVFQRPVPFPFSIRHNLALPLRERGVRDRRRLAEAAERVLREVGLWEEVAGRLDAPAHALSGGQQQRLCLARALLLEPEVLLLVRLRSCCTIVLVTHQLAQARRIADHLGMFWLENGVGRLLEAGPREQILARPRHPVTRAYVLGLRG